jgi:hypothetical protein
MRTLFASACFALGLLAVPALAQPDEKPAIELKTRTAEITVIIDKRLQDDPALFANLRAEGRRFVAESRTEADEGYKTIPEWFKEDRRYSYRRDYAFHSRVADRYVSIVRNDSVYTGGAHPNTFINTILWDSAQKKRVSIRPFFKETAANGPAMTALAKLIRMAVAAEKRARWDGARSAEEKKEPLPPAAESAEKDEQLKDAVQASLLKLGPISLAPSTAAGKSSGLAVHFSPYDVDAYAAGPYTVFVPWTAFEAHLSTAGTAIFGGDRPKADEEQK